MIIDCHGHFTTVPKSLNTWRQKQLDSGIMNNVYFDTCVYHQAGIDVLTRVVKRRNILSGSEMIGAVKGIDPETGHYYDDTKRYVSVTPHLDDRSRQYLFLTTF